MKHAVIGWAGLVVLVAGIVLALGVDAYRNAATRSGEAVRHQRIVLLTGSVAVTVLLVAGVAATAVRLISTG